jgi:hypothetical protein
MIKKIERPDWAKLPDLHEPMLSAVPKAELYNWFETTITPINKMLDNAVEVYSYTSILPDKTSCLSWCENRSIKNHKEKALLINIEPIKKESAEDVLRDMIKRAKDDKFTRYAAVEDAIERAKAVLGEGGIK